MSTGPSHFDVDNLIGRRAASRWDRVSVGDMFERVCWSYPDQEAVVGGPGAYGSERYARLTYRQADHLANQVANALIARGLKPGDRVMYFCENTVEAYISKFGVAKAGMVCTPLNARVSPDVQDYLFDLLKPKAFFVDAELWPAAADVFTRRGVKGVMIPVGGRVLPPGWQSFEQFVEGSPTTESDVSIHGDDIWQILPTSGTTAMPKGVMMSHHFSYYSAYSHALSHTRGLRFESELRACSVLPMIYHAADQTQSFPTYLCGGTFVLGRNATGERFAELISRERCTHLWAGSPQFMEDMAEAVDKSNGRYDISSLTSIMFAWASCPPSVADALKRLCGPKLHLAEILGQTEALVCSRFFPDKWPEIYRASAPAINHCGLPNPLVAATIMDEAGNIIPRNRPDIPGEIVYRTPGVTAGYYKNEEATREAFRNGWFHSGDCCTYDENGLMVMVDRYKDVVKSGGENVSTIRVEAVVKGHPAVFRVAVVGLPHTRWGEAVTAVVIRKPGQNVDEAELLAFARTRLAGFESPKGVIFTEALPETVGNKVLKYVLRQRYHDHYKNAE